MESSPLPEIKYQKSSETSYREFPFQLFFLPEFAGFSIGLLCGNSTISVFLETFQEISLQFMAVVSVRQTEALFCFLVFVVYFLKRESQFCQIPSKRIQPRTFGLHHNFFLVTDLLFVSVSNKIKIKDFI